MLRAIVPFVLAMIVLDGASAAAPANDALDERINAAHEGLSGGRVDTGRFLPMPLARPMRLPQQEAPGVVVQGATVAAVPAAGSADPDPAVAGVDDLAAYAAAPAPVIPEMMLRSAGQTAAPLSLSYFAYGAYQRGLYATALKVALRAAADDDPNAAALIGWLYEEAKGVKQDLAKAAGWYAVAADLGSAEAQNRLAAMFLTGRGVPEDPGRAADGFAAAAEAGSADAAYSLALLILKGNGRERDLTEAFRYMKQAAEGGEPAAQYALAVMYDEGQGTVPDEVAATRWFGRAAQARDESALVEYAIRLFNGVGTPADETRAAAFFAEAARMGNVVAMNRLARLLANGRGVPFDATEAIKWHLLARRAGRSDLFLDGFMGTRDPAIVAEAERRASAFRSD